MKTELFVTKYISGIYFVSASYPDDIIEIGVDTVSLGSVSLTLPCIVRNKDTQEALVRVEKLVFVAVDRSERPTPHALA